MAEKIPVEVVANWGAIKLAVRRMTAAVDINASTNDRFISGALYCIKVASEARPDRTRQDVAEIAMVLFEGLMQDYVSGKLPLHFKEVVNGRD